MNVLLADQVREDLLSEAVCIGGIVLFDDQPVGEVDQTGEVSLFIPEFFTDFRRDEHVIIPTMESGHYGLELLSDDQHIKARPTEEGWQLTMVDHETGVGSDAVTWFERFDK